MRCGEPLKLVLVVEDDVKTRESIRHALQQNPCIIAAAADGAEALRFLEHDQPDAIVLDVHLPSLEGRDVLDELRARGLMNRVPVIVMADIAELALLQECACVVRKAGDQDALRAAVQRALSVERYLPPY